MKFLAKARLGMERMPFYKKVTRHFEDTVVRIALAGFVAEILVAGLTQVNINLVSTELSVVRLDKFLYFSRYYKITL